MISDEVGERFVFCSKWGKGFGNIVTISEKRSEMILSVELFNHSIKSRVGCLFRFYADSFGYAQKHKYMQIFSQYGYESFSDVGESRVWFASKNLTPCRMH